MPLIAFPSFPTLFFWPCEVDFRKSTSQGQKNKVGNEGNAMRGIEPVQSHPTSQPLVASKMPNIGLLVGLALVVAIVLYVTKKLKPGQRDGK